MVSSYSTLNLPPLQSPDNIVFYPKKYCKEGEIDLCVRGRALGGLGRLGWAITGQPASVANTYC